MASFSESSRLEWLFNTFSRYGFSTIPESTLQFVLETMLWNCLFQFHCVFLLLQATDVSLCTHCLKRLIPRNIRRLNKLCASFVHPPSSSFFPGKSVKIIIMPQRCYPYDIRMNPTLKIFYQKRKFPELF